MVELRFCKARVAGSIPASGSIDTEKYPNAVGTTSDRYPEPRSQRSLVGFKMLRECGWEYIKLNAKCCARCKSRDVSPRSKLEVMYVTPDETGVVPVMSPTNKARRLGCSQ